MSRKTQSLSQSHPNLVKDRWDYVANGELSPDNVTAGIRKKIWWKCQKSSDHRWSTVLYSYAAGKGLCPFCSGKRVSVTNRLDIKYPNLIKDWSYKNPKTIKEYTWGSSQKVWWKCDEGHEYEARIAARTGKKNGCPYCSGRQAHSGRNLAITFPEIAKLWDYENNKDLAPNKVQAVSAKVVWWKCPISLDHSWQDRVASLTGGGKNCGCPFCSGKRLSVTNRLDILYPHLIEEWSDKNKKTPDQYTFGSSQKVWWKCKQNHEWDARISGRTTLNTNCPYCSGNLPHKENNLAIVFPETAKFWDIEKNGILKPESVTPVSTKMVWWTCNIGDDHKWQGSVASLTSKGKRFGCPFCSGRRLHKLNSFAFKNPELIKEWSNKNKKTPYDVTFGSGIKFWWTCEKCSFDWKASCAKRSGGGGCPKCCESKGEKKVRNHLNNYNAIFTSEWSHETCKDVSCLRFDFAIFQIEEDEFPVATIEFNGIQHYEAIGFFGGNKGLLSCQKRDNIKKEWCEQNEIPLLTIKYTSINEVNKLVENFLTTLKL